MGAGASAPSRTIQATPQCGSSNKQLESSMRVASPPPGTSPTAATANSSSSWAWEYEEFPAGPWRPFEDTTSQQLEAAFATRRVQEEQDRGNHVSVLIGSRVLHTVNVVNLRAVGPGGASRPVRRVCADASATEVFAAEGKSPIRKTAETSADIARRDPLLDNTVLSGEASMIDHLEYSTTNPLLPTLHSIIQAHQSAVFGITFSAEGSKLVTGAKDGSCKYWEVDTSFLITEFAKHPGSVLSTAMSQTAPLIVTGCDDDKARIFSAKESQPRAVLEGHEHKVYSVAFTCDGKHVVTTSMDDTLKLWDVTSYQAVRSVSAHRSSIFSLQVSCQTPHLAITAGDDAMLVSHDFRLNNTVTAKYIGHESTLWGCDIRFDDGQFISCGMDARVCLWDPRNPSAPLNVVRSHKNPVHCVEYMPDGRTFLSSARDRSFRLTVANTGKEVFHCIAHEGNVYRVTYNAATSRIMTCGSDSLVKLWTVPPIILGDE